MPFSVRYGCQLIGISSENGLDRLEPCTWRQGFNGRHRGRPRRKPSKGRINRRRHRLEEHTSTALAFAGDRPEWVNAFLQEFRQLFSDMVLNLAINANLDGNSIYKSQQRFMLKKVGVFA